MSFTIGKCASTSISRKKQAATHSLRCALDGTDEDANEVGSTDFPLKIRDETGSIVAQGGVETDGRLPRQEIPKHKELTLQHGDDRWIPFASTLSTMPVGTNADYNTLQLSNAPLF